MNLADFQDAFVASLLHPNRTIKTSERQAGGMALSGIRAKHFSAYRELILADLRLILIEVYPTVAKLMLAEDFARVGNAFFLQYPPTSVNPVSLTELFATFLEQLIASEPGALAKQGYLPDLATLDYGCYQALNAVDANAITTRMFTDISPEMLTVRKIHLHPACFWLSSDYAIYDLWRHQQTDPHTVLFEREYPQEVVIIRRKLQVEVHRADIGLVKMLDALDAGETLNVALLQGTLADPRFNAVGAMQFLIQNDLIINLY
jgi:hypothetical protein